MYSFRSLFVRFLLWFVNFKPPFNIDLHIQNNGRLGNNWHSELDFLWSDFFLHTWRFYTSNTRRYCRRWSWWRVVYYPKPFRRLFVLIPPSPAFAFLFSCLDRAFTSTSMTSTELASDYCSEWVLTEEIEIAPCISEEDGSLESVGSSTN